MYIFNIFDLILLSIISFFTTFISFYLLKKRKHFDLNTLKLSQSKNIVTSLGISFSINFVIIFLYTIIFNQDIWNILPNRNYIFFGSIIILSLVSFWDDIKEIDPKFRLIIQLIVVYFSLTNLDLQNLNVPLKLIIFLALIIWVYIINITNFIDGSDGHCAIHSISFFIGIIYISSFFQLENFSFYLAIVNLIILFWFSIFNKPSAKAYMGDVGSIYLGYIIGFIILENILLSKSLYVLSIFLYPIIDCTITLAKKTYNGIYPWVKMGDYFFLKPIINGQNHKKVFFVSIIYNIVNLFFLFLQINFSDLFFILNVLNAFILLIYFNSFKK